MNEPSRIDELVAEVTAFEDDLYASRQERKYVLATPIAEALRAAVEARLRREAFVPGRTLTRIHSIYFDSEDFTLFRQSLADEASNLKFRVRSYGDAAAAGAVDRDAFFECKLGVTAADARRKHKLRVRLRPQQASALFNGEAVQRASTDMLSLANKQHFWRKALRFVREHRLIPRLSVAYVREAFVSDDGRLRVTFDDGYLASRIHTGVTSRPADARAALSGRIIAEVKFVGAFPAWLEAAMAALGVASEGQSFSKFKTGVPLLYGEVRP